MPTVSADADAYQDLETIRERVDYSATDFFDDQNAQLQFDELLVRLEREARGIFETLWGDQTPATETGRTDVRRATDDAALTLVYPIQEVDTVEYKTTLSSDWETLDTDRWDHTDHHLVLAERPNVNSLRYHQRGNALAANAERATWRDLAAKVRVTYDRGFDPVPSDVLSIQIQLITNMLRQLKREQTVAAASPEEFAGQTETNEVVTDEVRNRISDVTSPGRATMSI
jgi:hypothetical protein